MVHSQQTNALYKAAIPLCAIPNKPKTAKPVIIGWVTFLSLFLIVFISSCHSDSRNKKDEFKPAALGFEDSLYQSYIYTALSYKRDSLLKHLDSILPKAYADNYRVRAYRSFLYGYNLLKQRKTDTAEHIFRNMLPKNGLDTARDFELLTLQQGVLLLMKLNKGTNPGTLGQLMPALTLVEKYHARFRWWIYAMAGEVWYFAGEPIKARSYAWLAYQSIPDTTDYALRGLLMYHISETERLQDNMAGALKYLDSAYAWALKSDDKKLQASVASTKALALIAMGDTAKGNQLQQQALEQSKGNSKNELGLQFFNTATAHYSNKNFEAAIHFARKGSELALESKNTFAISSIYKILADSYHSLKQYDSSFHYMTESYNYYIRYLNELQAKEIASLEVQHTLEKEIDEKKGLAEKSKIQEAEIKSQNVIVDQQRMIILGVVFLLFLLFVLAYVIRRQARLRSDKMKLEAEKEKVKLQQRLFRSQMEPHFIFNTQAASIGFIRRGEPDKAIAYLTKFGRLLRVNLEHSMQSFVPLVQELEALENYLSLQQMRFENLFDFHIEAYEGHEEDDLFIPPMLIQPFVENAIYHGFHNIDYKGQLTIIIRKEEGVLHCITEDNGRGIQHPAHEGQKRSFATTITRERLQILSKENNKKADLHVISKSAPGTGTIVTLDIPFETAFTPTANAFSLTDY